VTYQSLLDAYQNHEGNAPLSLEEKGMIWLWLTAPSAKQAEDVTNYDEPFGDGPVDAAGVCTDRPLPDAAVPHSGPHPAAAAGDRHEGLHQDRRHLPGTT